MARQRIHNSRAGRGSGGSGASWISYSDMMAALLLLFVLILCTSLYQYFQMLEVKTLELDEQKALVSAQTLQLASQSVELDNQKAKVVIIQTELDAKADELENTRIILMDKEAELNAANEALAAHEDELIILQTELAQKQIALNAATEVLNSQREALDAQTAKIDDLVGMRTRIIQDLSSALSQANIRAQVDPKTGNIVLDSAVLFQTGSSTILNDGRDLLNRFIPVYLSVLLQPEYIDYLGQIIIEGHTDSVGEYMSNLKLSQDRALSVAQYVLSMSSLTSSQQVLLQHILTATGRSESDLIYYPNGMENADASRRVEFKFSLKDAEMIEELNLLLQSN